jgi:hypothetical protein
MDCDFEAETWELRRDIDGSTRRLARADIRVILGTPGTPQLVIEFKKLNGTTTARRLYCFEGVSRFVSGKYGADHEYGTMCGFACPEPDVEATALAAYIAAKKRARRLACVRDSKGKVIRVPSSIAPQARFDTVHTRAGQPAMTVLHMLLQCPQPPSAGRSPAERVRRKVGRTDGRRENAGRHSQVVLSGSGA